MSIPWEAFASALVGVAVTLVGVASGAALTSVTQTRHWSRDKQIAACTAIIVESTRVQLALWRQWRDQHRVNWAPWNEALAVICLISNPVVVEAAARMDEVFWHNSDQLDSGESSTEAAWLAATERMESARLNFINVARKHVIDSKVAISDFPVRRPFMPASPEDVS